MDYPVYIKEHIIWSMLAFLCLKNLIFRCIPNCTYVESLIGFIIISLCVMTVGIAASWQRNRNYKNLIENILLSWGVFVCITYWDLYNKQITNLLLVVLFVSLVLSFIVMLRRINRKKYRQKIIIRRMANLTMLWKRIAAISSMLLIIPIVSSSLIHGTVLNSKIEVTKVYGDEHRMKANIETISNIEPSRWKNQSMEDKLLIIQKIVNCEARFYGLSHEILVGVDGLSNGTLAYYNHSTHQVVIDLEHLQNAYSYDILETLLHEVQHAYQHNQVDLYKRLTAEDRNLLLFNNASIYMDEFSNYEENNENFFVYYTQLSEIHAREVSETESLEYVEAINKYLGIELDVDMDKFSCIQEYVDYISKE